MNDPEFYLLLNEQQTGPYTLEQLRSMWASGAVTLNTLFWQEGMAEWKPLRNIVALLQPRTPEQAASEMLGESIPSAAQNSSPSNQASCGGCLGGCLGMLLILMLLFSALAGLGKAWDALTVAWNTTKISVNASQYGSGWPLTVTHGTIRRIVYSKDRVDLIFEAPNGRKYGLNGTAQASRYHDIHQITKVEKTYDDGTPLYEDVEGLIDMGLRGSQ
jgi:hypothetical protein